MQNLKGRIPYDIHGPVFFIGAALIIGFTALAMLLGPVIDDLFGRIQAIIASYTGWFYVLVMNLMLGFTIYLIFSRFANIRLGGAHARPEFSTPAWFAMLFSAGMGIGLLFYGVAEPLFHFTENPFSHTGQVEAARTAMDFTFLHWGLHPWAVYALVGLALAFCGFNLQLPLSIRTAFSSVLGNRIYGPIGNVIDILATVATLFGVSTSLGLGVKQVNAGLDHLFGIGQSAEIQVMLIAGITAMATWSVLKGLQGGIRRLSEINIYLAGALMLFVLILGPTLFICNGWLENVGYYIHKLPQLATWSETYEATDWQNGWTVFYWGWWIAWSPFVGMFIARVSFGRTVKEFLLGVLLVPSIVTSMWMTVFGNSSIYIEMFGNGGLAQSVEQNIPVSLFKFLEHFPLPWLTSGVAILVIIAFFVTSSDSGSMVIDIITAGGKADPPKPQRLFWAILEGAVAAALLLGGGLVALQTAAITTGLPFAVVLLLLCWSLLKGFKQYLREAQKPPVKDQQSWEEQRHGSGS